LLLPTNETHASDNPECPQQKKPIEFTGSFAVAVEHRRIVIKTKKMGKVKSMRKAVKGKALISEREDMFHWAGSLMRFCP